MPYNIYIKKDENKKKKRKMPTSKKLIWFLFFNCTIIELVVIFVTFKSLSLASSIGLTPDFTPLITLVGAVVSEVIGYAVYAAKSTKENTSGGISYDMAMREVEDTSSDPSTENTNK